MTVIAHPSIRLVYQLLSRGGSGETDGSITLSSGRGASQDGCDKGLSVYIDVLRFRNGSLKYLKVEMGVEMGIVSHDYDLGDASSHK